MGRAARPRDPRLNLLAAVCCAAALQLSATTNAGSPEAAAFSTPAAAAGLLQPKPGWATKWRRHLDFTINHACWCRNGDTADGTHYKCNATVGGTTGGDYSCFQNYTGPA